MAVALEALPDALPMAARPFGVHVAVVQPGPVATSFDVNSADLSVCMDGRHRLPAPRATASARSRAASCWAGG